MRRLNSLSLSGWQWAWLALCLANLALPLFLGWDVTSNGGRVGMLSAVGFTLVLGIVLVERWSRLRVALAIGSVVTAVSQAFPLLQIVAGSVSLDAVNRLGHDPGTGFGNERGLTELGGFAVTLLTAGLMILAALAGGGAFQLLCWAMEPGQDRVLQRTRSAGAPGR